MNSIRISVVINTIDRADSLLRTLRSLEWLDFDNFEVVVVKGPSSDHTDDVLRQYRDRAKIADCPSRNLSASRNIGIQMSAGEVIAFIDDDAYPDPSWLTSLAAAYRDAEVAGAGGPTFDHTGYGLQARWSIANRLGEAWVGAPSQINPTAYLSQPLSDQFVYPIGTNSSFRRNSLVAIGGFDEEVEYYADEVDVCCRLVDAGFVISALDDGFVYHKFLPSAMRRRSDVVSDWFQVLKSRFYFALKHGTPLHSFADMCASLATFVADIRARVQADHGAGKLPLADVEKFEEDVRRASDLALARYVEGPGRRERSPEWFDADPQPFLPFPRRLPAGRKLHLCFLSSEYPPDPVNGIGRVVHSLACGLAERGHVVRVITQGEGHSRVDLEDGVWVHRVVAPPTDDLPLALPSYVRDPAMAAVTELERIASLRKIDAVQAPNWDSQGIGVLLKGDLPLIVGLYTPLHTLVRVDLIERGISHDDTIRQLLEAERYVYEHAAGYLACGQAVVDEIEGAYGVELDQGRLGFVAHGLPDLAAADSMDTPSPSSPAIRLLFVGRLEARKGIDLLLRSVAMLDQDHVDFHLTVVGDDTVTLPSGSTARYDFEKLHPEMATRVAFLGRVDDDRLIREYQNCDVVVAPSRFESFGLMIVEAMMFGKAVVCSDTGGMGEVLVDGVTGRLVPPDDTDALLNALVWMANHPRERVAMGREGRRIFEERFSQDAMASQAERFYYQLITSGLGNSASREAF